MLKKKKHIINGLFIVFPITVLYNNFAFWNIAMEGKKMSAKKSKMKNLTEGSPAKLIIGFAIPMFLGMLFQQFYSMVDTMIVGKFLGLKPLAGVGSTGSLNFMVIGFCIGVCNGFAIPVAQKFGAKDESALRRFVANATWLCVGFAVVMTLASSVFCRDILLFLRTPEDVFQYAYWYMLIIFLGIPCTFLYNFLAALIRSLGDSRTPVVFLAISSVLNIGLDLLFILLFRWGVIGAALATVLSQGISGICLFVVCGEDISNPAWQPKRVEGTAQIYGTSMYNRDSYGTAVFYHSDRNSCDPGGSQWIWSHCYGRSDRSGTFGKFPFLSNRSTWTDHGTICWSECGSRKTGPGRKGVKSGITDGLLRVSSAFGDRRSFWTQNVRPVS